MPETPGFFPTGDGTPLYGVYHAPEARASRPPGAAETAAVPARGHPARTETASLQGAVVIAPPLFEERKSAYGALAQLARGLAAAGFGVFRFDYRGSGESGGDPGERRWQHLAEDLNVACAAARRLSGCDRLTLTGVRLSATLILTEAARLKPERVVAIAPILKGATEVRLWRLRSKMRSELGGEASPTSEKTAEGVVDLDGFPVHSGFFGDLQKVDLSAAAPIECPVLLVQVSHRETPLPDYERLVSVLGPKVALACIKALPFWERVENAEIGEMLQRVAEFVEERVSRSE